MLVGKHLVEKGLIISGDKDGERFSFNEND
jgi:hypothetical protein